MDLNIIFSTDIFAISISYHFFLLLFLMSFFVEKMTFFNIFATAFSYYELIEVMLKTPRCEVQN